MKIHHEECTETNSHCKEQVCICPAPQRHTPLSDLSTEELRRYLMRGVQYGAEREYIILVLNAHEELVNSLKDAIIDLEALYNHSKTYGKFAVSLGMFRRLSAMKEAIAKAEAR